MAKKRKRVLVTGGSGFIGGHLIDTFVRAGFSVRNVERNFKDHTGHGGKVANYSIDISAPHAVDSLTEAMRGVEWVFHVAARPRVQDSFENPTETARVNTLGTIAVLEAAHKADVRRLVYAASSSAYGDQLEMPLRESMTPNPTSPYALQKYDGELWCKLFSQPPYNLETVCLRLFNVYGPRASAEGAYALVIAKFLAQRERGEPMTITGDGTQTRDFTHVNDVVCAILLAAKSKKVGRGEVINIGAGKNASVNQVADLIGGPRIHIDARQEPHDTLADISLAKELLRWKPRKSLEDGLAELKVLHGLA